MLPRPEMLSWVLFLQVHGPDKHALSVAVGETRPFPTSLSVYVPCSHSKENIFRFRTTRCYGRQTKFEGVSDRVATYGDRGSDLCPHNGPKRDRVSI